MHPSAPLSASGQPSPVVLYSRPGCHLCEDTLLALEALLTERAAAGRSVPPIVERDITTDPAWEREFLVTIPVLELDGHRLELATSHARIRSFLAEALDGEGSTAAAMAPARDAARETA